MQMDFSRSIVDIVLDHGNSDPDRPALIFDQGDGPPSSPTYAEAAARVRQLAGALEARGLAARGLAAEAQAGPGARTSGVTGRRGRARVARGGRRDSTKKKNNNIRD